MITVRKAVERGHAEHGWLDSWHSFSFGEYFDAKHMGFGALRVINEDRVAPGQGFPRHPHRDMEILSYVLEGALQHEDSMGTGSVIRPGDVQRMTAGTGVTHSEYNGSRDEAVHFLQIWIMPERQGIAPSYEQKGFDASVKRGKLKLVASRAGEEGSVTVHQDVRLYAGLFDGAENAVLPLAVGRKAWIHVARGNVRVNGTSVTAGDAVAVSEEDVRVDQGNGAEVLVFDLAS